MFLYACYFSFDISDFQVACLYSEWDREEDNGKM